MRKSPRRRQVFAFFVALTLLMQLVPAQGIQEAFAVEGDEVGVEQVNDEGQDATEEEAVDTVVAPNEDQTPANEEVPANGDVATDSEQVADQNAEGEEDAAQETEAADAASDAKDEADAKDAEEAKEDATDTAQEESKPDTSIKAEKVSALETTVSTWADLKSAIEGASGETTITISDSFDSAGVASTIEIKSGQKITLTGTNATVTKAEGCTGALFSIASGGTLTLDKGVTYKGKTSGKDHGTTNGALFVYSEGTLNIEGATISDFVSEYSTDSSNSKNYKSSNLDDSWSASNVSDRLSPFGGYLKNSAPIYVKGSSAVLNMTSGTIQNNRVGYPLSDAEAAYLATTGYGMLHGVLYNADAGFEGRRTGSSGAITLNGGATATISGGIIQKNMGDAGAIHVAAGSTLNMPMGDPISHDIIKEQHDGLLQEPHWNDFVNAAGKGLDPRGALIMDNTGLTMGTVCVRSNEDLMGTGENGKSIVQKASHYDPSATPSEFVMKGGLIFDNINWFRGAVSVSGDAKFAMTSDRSLADEGMYPIVATNLSREKGGGVYVHSNNVTLVKGWIIDNESWAMGGGVYVEGPYKLRVADAAVYQNYATFSDRFNTSDLEERYKPQSDNDKKFFGNTDARFGGTPHTNDCDFSTGRDEFFPGSGGGIWLCPTGSMYFDATAAYLGKNVADSQGNDFFKDTGSAYDGSAGGTLVRFDDDYHTWEFDRDPVQGSDKKFDSEVHGVLGGEGQFGEQSVLALKNVSSDTTLANINSHEGVHIAFNASRRGGGIGCNGYVAFTKADSDDEYSFSAKLKVTKEWDDTVPESERAGHLHLTAFYDHKGELVELKQFILGDKTAAIDHGSEGDAVTTVGEYQAEVNSQVDGGMTLDGWTAELTLPTSIYGSTLFDHTKAQEAFEEDGTYTMDPDEFNIVFYEYDHSWENVTNTYRLDASDVTVTGFKRDSRTETLSPYNKPMTITFTTDTFDLEQTLTNHLDEPAIEKYVDKDVHEALSGGNEEIDYDILAWVPRDATKLTITDSLVDALEFVGGSKAAVDVTYKYTNDHKVYETVANEGHALDETTAKAVKTTIKGQNLTVQMDDVKALRGTWVQVSFKAQLKAAYQTMSAAELRRVEGIGWEEVTDNGEVLNGETPHAGISNTAKYKVTTQNTSQSYAETESNTVTVTVKPSVLIEATKTSEGRELKKDEHSFQLRDDSGEVLQTAKSDANGIVNFSSLSFADEGTYTFTVNEVQGSDSDVTYDDTVYTVVVTVAEEDGALKAHVKYYKGNSEVEGIAFDNLVENDNTYKPVSTTIEAVKTLEGRTLKKGEFKFHLVDAHGKSLQTKSNDAKGIVLFNELTFDKPGTYTYQIHEDEDNPAIAFDGAYHVVTVHVHDNGDGTLTATQTVELNGKKVDYAAFDNVVEDAPTYDALIFSLKAKKTLTGRTLKKDEFSFKVDDVHGQKYETRKNAADGSIVLDGMSVTKEGTYVYEISEVKGSDKTVTYDKSTFTATVQVKEGDDGELAVQSITYEKDGEVQDSATFVNKVSTTVTPVTKKSTPATLPKRLAKTADTMTTFVILPLMVVGLLMLVWSGALKRNRTED